VFAVVGSDTGYVAVGSAGMPQAAHPADRLTGTIWWSADGKTWSRVAVADTHGQYRQTQFLGVAHGPTGWIAAGWRQRADTDAATSRDEIVWTSPDGQHWSPTERAGDAFAQHAWATGAGATAAGYAVIGTGVRGPLVLWMGSPSVAHAPTGTVDGSMHEVGGPAPGLDRPLSGTLTTTATDGTQQTATVDKDGRFSIDVPPGRYTVVGRSPLYGSGHYTCGSDTGPVVVLAGGLVHVDLFCPIE
jgi:hypothetical protein